jgi:hypothetical protein
MDYVPHAEGYALKAKIIYLNNLWKIPQILSLYKYPNPKNPLPHR